MFEIIFKKFSDQKQNEFLNLRYFSLDQTLISKLDKKNEIVKWLKFKRMKNLNNSRAMVEQLPIVIELSN